MSYCGLRISFGTIRTAALTYFALAFYLFFITTVAGQSESHRSPTIDQFRQATVSIRTKWFAGQNDSDPSCPGLRGSGVLISSRGYILTAEHIFRKPRDCPVQYSRQVIEISVGASRSDYWIKPDLYRPAEPPEDLALLLIHRKNGGYQFATPCTAAPDDTISLTGFGYPSDPDKRHEQLDLQSHLLRYQNDETGAWTVSGAITHGMSGGPVLMGQRLVGIITAGAPGEAVKFVIPIRFGYSLLRRAGIDPGECTGISTPGVIDLATIRMEHTPSRILYYQGKRLISVLDISDYQHGTAIKSDDVTRTASSIVVRLGRLKDMFVFSHFYLCGESICARHLYAAIRDGHNISIAPTPKHGEDHFGVVFGRKRDLYTVYGVKNELFVWDPHYRAAGRARSPSTPVPSKGVHVIQIDGN